MTGQLKGMSSSWNRSVVVGSESEDDMGLHAQGAARGEEKNGVFEGTWSLSSSECRQVWAPSTPSGERAVKTAADTSVKMYQLQSPSASSSESNLIGNYYKQIVWQSGCDLDCAFIAMGRKGYVIQKI